jgi:hypothetical protein
MSRVAIDKDGGAPMNGLNLTLDKIQISCSLVV